MGASYNEQSVDGTMTIAELKATFAIWQDVDRYENGHSYSGGFGMARGLTIKSTPVYDSYEAASEYLDNTCEKHRNAIAVKYANPDTGALTWLVGALCAS